MYSLSISMSLDIHPYYINRTEFLKFTHYTFTVIILWYIYAFIYYKEVDPEFGGGNLLKVEVHLLKIPNIK